MALELVTPLPPGAQSFTKLARHGSRLVVLRELKDGTDCSYPQASAGLVTLQEVGELQGKRHALFPWVPGATLREVLQALELVGQPVPLGLVGRVLIDGARALARVQPPRAHGGLQDGALQLGFDGAVSVLDWGAPRVTRFRPLGRVSFAADVFALGGVLHSALTGFQGEYATRASSLPMPSSSHPAATPALDAVVARALSAEPDSRQASAGAFADELEAVLAEDLFTNERLGEVVRALFKDRIRLLRSLGGDVSVPGEIPSPIPTGTQPGTPPALGDAPSEPTLPRIPAPPPKELVPWDTGPELPSITPVARPPGDTGDDEALTRPHTVPVIDDAQTRPHTMPTLEEGTRRRATGDDLPATLAGRPSALRRMTGEQAASVPRRSTGEHPPLGGGDTAPRGARLGPADSLADGDTNPRASAPSARAVGPASSLDDGDTNPRASAPSARAAGPASSLDDGDTNPRASAPGARVGSPASSLDDGDTNPRGRAPALGEEIEPTRQRPIPPPAHVAEVPGPRNTTTAERLQARGQERVATPPLGTPAAEPEPGASQEVPTAVRERPQRVETLQTAETAQRLPAVRATGGTGVRVLMLLLLVVVVGLAVAVLLKVQRATSAPELVLDAADAGDDEEWEEDDGGEELAALSVPEVDAGAPDAGPADGGEDDAGVVDAGTVDAGVADAGSLDAGAPPRPAPVKAPVKKKKKRRRR